MLRVFEVLMTLEMAWKTRHLQLVLSGGPVTPTPIREYNGLRGENRGPFKGRQASASKLIMCWENCIMLKHFQQAKHFQLLLNQKVLAPLFIKKNSQEYMKKCTMLIKETFSGYSNIHYFFNWHTEYRKTNYWFFVDIFVILLYCIRD